MDIWREVEGAATSPPPGRTVVTIGSFDGVHLGHQHVLRRAHELADRLGVQAPLPVVAVTFDPHPLRVLAPAQAPVQLSTPAERVALLVRCGADEVLVLAFDREMAGWSPEEFIDRVLVDALGAAGVVVGENFRFGAGAAGDVELLTEQGRDRRFVTEALGLDGEDQPWSSTCVRGMVAEGDVGAAAHALGRLHSVRGVVVEGDKRGREMGYPTANVPADAGTAMPADGVYAGWLRRLDDGSAPMPAAISVGTNPTFDGVERRVESYVLDRDDLELYGVPVEVCFTVRVRGQVRFDDMDDLVLQMADDVDVIRRLLTDAPAP